MWFDCFVLEIMWFSCFMSEKKGLKSRSFAISDRPDPPSNVVLVNTCLDNKAELKWTPGSDNNDRIIEYIVYCNTSHDPPDRFKTMIQVPESSSHKSAVLNLFPWTTYSFHVTARNSLGESRRSSFTSESKNCTTPSAMPFRHPKEVCTVSRKEDELVIVWQVSRIEFSFIVDLVQL